MVNNNDIVPQKSNVCVIEHIYKKIVDAAKELGADIQIWSYDFPISSRIIINIPKQVIDYEHETHSPEAN